MKKQTDNKLIELSHKVEGNAIWQCLSGRNHKFSSFKSAFTLAEVLITLAIIGVVAAFTIPTLIQKYQEQAWITGTKKFYNVMSRAVQMAVLDNGLPETWDLSNPENMIKPLMPYLKITEYCTSKNGKVCYNNMVYNKNGTFYEGIGKYLLNGTNKDRPALRLNDGTVVSVLVQSTDCNNLNLGICGEYYADINGEKGPNIDGKDVFFFVLTKDGQIRPYGTPEYDEFKMYSFQQGCLATDSEGTSCSGWVVMNGNMDYLHCDDLSWNGKHKCD